MSQPQSFPGPIKAAKLDALPLTAAASLSFGWAILRHKIQFISPTENIVVTYEIGYEYGKR